MGLVVTLIVLNNQILGYQKHAETIKFGQHTEAVFFEPVDHAAIARACGLTGIRVEQVSDFGPALDAAFANDHTTLIDVITDPKQLDATRRPYPFQPEHRTPQQPWQPQPDPCGETNPSVDL